MGMRLLWPIMPVLNMIRLSDIRLRKLLSLVVVIALFACAPASETEIGADAEANTNVSATPVSPAGIAASQPIVGNISPGPTAGGIMATQILYYEYEYFQMEGIPPYPSPYVAMDIRDRHWVDMNDPLRSRYEVAFRTREPNPKEGVERVVIGTGAGGVMEDCQTYDGKTECTQTPIAATLDYSSWLSATTALGRTWLAGKDNPEAIHGQAYVGIQTDDVWGTVHVFQKEGTLEASDLYPKYPMVETMKFDADLFRAVAWERTVMNGDERIAHAWSRLVAWKVMDVSESPADLFALRSK